MNKSCWLPGGKPKISFMKNILLLVPFFFLSTFIGTPKLLPRNKHLPRIAVAGIAIESSTFSPEQTDEAAFHAHYGKDVLSAKMVPLSDHLN